jgi:serine/threonine protein phosphatase 1
MTVVIERSRPWPALRRPPADTAVAAIGDVHGQRDLFERLRAAVVDDLAETGCGTRVLVHLGDLADRGPDGIACLDLARTAVEGVETVTLMGNHDDFLLDAATGAGHYPQGAWLANGGVAVLRELGVEPGAGLAGRLEAALGDERLAFLARMPRLLRLGDLVFVHAGIDPERPLDDQDPEELIWIREPFLLHPGPFDQHVGVVHGHTPQARPDLGHPHRIGIDTGAFMTGVLSALVIAGDRMHLVQARRDED